MPTKPKIWPQDKPKQQWQSERRLWQSQKCCGLVEMSPRLILQRTNLSLFVLKDQITISKHFSNLNLETSNESNKHSHNSAEAHQHPEIYLWHLSDEHSLWQFSENKHQWNEHETSIQIIVIIQCPHWIIHDRQSFLGINWIQGDTAGWQNSKNNSFRCDSTWMSKFHGSYSLNN